MGKERLAPQSRKETILRFEFESGSAVPAPESLIDFSFAQAIGGSFSEPPRAWLDLFEELSPMQTDTPLCLNGRETEDEEHYKSS